MAIELSQAESPASQIERQILTLVEQYVAIAHASKPFVAGETKVQYSGRFFDDAEVKNGVRSVLQYWLTAGPFAREFEDKMRGFFGSRGALLVNSGSSANLLMVATLCSRNVPGHLVPGDEVITPAVTFPTTLTPVVQNGLIPVFVDCRPGEYNVAPEQLEAAVGPRTRALFIPHTVGIPFDMDAARAVAEKHDLWLLEDGCDALGATWDGKLVGTFGAMSSLSFYPAHHLSMGEGGLVVLNSAKVGKTALSIRDWGRDCWCEPGVSDTCGRRFEWQLGGLPEGYDHKYIYSNLGYNLKVTDIQAALGCAQFDKLPLVVARRRENAAFYLKELARFEEHLILPTVPAKANPSWFGFPITLRDHVDRREFVRWLEAGKVETRQVFGGNILKQPGFQHITHRLVGPLTGTDVIMDKTIFIGVYPGLTRPMREYVVDRIEQFFKGARVS